jgi:feruloyl esterase
MLRAASLAVVALMASPVCVVRPAMAATCEDLAATSLPATTITMARTVAAGAFTLPLIANPGAPPAAPAPNAFGDLPAFCRVAATLTPTNDSDIKIEVWLPASGWNGKFMAVGNGGWAGTISYPAMAQALRRGYATSSTDTGHVGGNATFVPGHPEKLVDYAYRSEHEMTLKAKLLIQAFYGAVEKVAYWNGCSTGGKQALTEAQRYPQDYDGIIAGAPANYMIHLHLWSLWVGQATHKDAESMIPPAKYPAIHKAVLDVCDVLDGVKDGLLEDPRRCHFDPQTIACQGADGPDCLTAPQVAAARQIYSPAINPRTKKLIFPPLEPGSELLWNFLAGPQIFSVPSDTFKYVIFNNPDWDYKTLNFDKDVEFADKADGGLNNAINPNLKPFFAHGGKLLMYHGWADQLIAPENSINYYQSVQAKLGGATKISDDMRLFMVPGMTHCGGGEGPDVFDTVGAIEQWVEKGVAPTQIIASHSTAGKVDRTRPLCPYPQVAKYEGAGSTDDAANFVCAAP